MGNTCIPVADHVDIWQNQYNIVKLKNIKNIHKEKNLQVIQRKKNHIIYKIKRLPVCGPLCLELRDHHSCHHNRRKAEQTENQQS